MKRLFFTILIMITCEFVYAQDYKVEFSINNDNTIVTYKIEKAGYDFLPFLYSRKVIIV